MLFGGRRISASRSPRIPVASRFRNRHGSAGKTQAMSKYVT